MEEIENNIIDYFNYFKKEKLWCSGNPLPESDDGFIKEFLVIGNFVNRFYLKEQKDKLVLKR